MKQFAANTLISLSMGNVWYNEYSCTSLHYTFSYLSILRLLPNRKKKILGSLVTTLVKECDGYAFGNGGDASGGGEYGNIYEDGYGGRDCYRAGSLGGYRRSNGAGYGVGYGGGYERY
ncbi:hypothetical protein CHS0354_016929 [Potamilus streckersoni]|uniref:Uncharacterized protein n=1 Tax=Potamilus streckersoni TaxID=2493646 RepID=A0AAE0S2L4_9BIVA|nr:hypothetical protein CHS0354_016929 [Potamilus streckersoni]